jgi:hypothetical protein
MPEPADLDARHRLGGHGARAHRRLMAHCQLKLTLTLLLTGYLASKTQEQYGHVESYTY